MGRRSVRSFAPGNVPRSFIEAAIEAAGWAPSPHGRQPWRFAIVESVEKREALADAMAETWSDQLALDGQDTGIIALRLQKSRERMLEASLLIIPCLYLNELDAYPDPERQEAERLMAIQSIGAAIQNALLSLYANGLDAGWMCAPLFCPDVVRDALGLEKSLIPHAMLPVGYAAKEPVRRPRLPVGTLITSWE
jgi:F420 biosynthesis protein FbiB-like protein